MSTAPGWAASGPVCPSDLADACPACPPGDHPAVLPSSVTPDRNRSLRASYRHEACGSEWDTWWDPEAAGWPLKRQNREARAQLEVKA